MSQWNLILFDSYGTEYPFEDTKSSLPNDTFTDYSVVEGKWILYKESDFNNSSGGGNKYDHLLLENPGSKTKLPFSPRSIRRLHDESDTAEVFEHYYYGGKSKVYTEACSDVTKSFPPNNYRGATSIIIWPNKSWELFKEKDFRVEGGETTLSPGKYPTPNDMRFKDNALQSLRPC